MDEQDIAESGADEDAFDHDALDPTADAISRVAEKASWKLLILLIVAGILFLILHFTSLGRQIRSWDTLSGLFRAGDFRAEMYFVLISSVLIMAGVPRLFFCTLAGFAFGFWSGLLWSTVGSLAGSFIAFRAARWGSREWLSARFGRHRFVQRIIHARPTVASVVLARTLPLANGMINVGLALSRVGNGTFLIGSLIGFMPEGIIATIIGSGLAHDVPWAGAIKIGLAGILLLILSVGASKRHRRP